MTQPMVEAGRKTGTSKPPTAGFRIIRGWIGYYGNFYRTQLRPTLKRIDLYVIRLSLIHI